MKVKQYTKEQLEKKIQQLRDMQGTNLEKVTDKKYLRIYLDQLNNLKS